jgi:hypothetical protein
MHRHLLATTCALGLLSTTRAFAQAPVPPPPPPWPAPSAAEPNELPPLKEPPLVPVEQRPKAHWYGWQILAPTFASEAMAFTAFFSAPGGTLLSGQGSKAGWAFFYAGLAGHGLSGPVVHLAHRHPLKALASLGLEAGLPAIAFATLFVPCNAGDDVGPCASLLVGLFLLLPLTLTAGTAIDSAALAWEPAAPRRAALAPSWTLAPLVLPPPRVASAPALTPPAGVAVVGTF